MSNMLGQIRVLAIFLLQDGRGRDERSEMEELWEPEVLLLILFLGGLVAIVTWLVLRIFPKVRRDERSEAPRDSAEEILRERFAWGEITAEEFQKSVEILRNRSTRRVRDDNQEGD